MASYIEGSLIDGEFIIYEGHISLWSVSHLLLLGTLLIPLFGLGFILLIAAYIKYKTTELAFTNKRLVVKKGFIQRQTVEIALAKVESIQVDQGVMGRIFNFGTLILSGAGTPQAPLAGISNPMAFRKAFMEANSGEDR